MACNRVARAAETQRRLESFPCVSSRLARLRAQAVMRDAGISPAPPQQSPVVALALAAAATVAAAPAPSARVEAS
eukprot:8258735-Pyramimonas_sp.AAC.1